MAPATEAPASTTAEGTTPHTQNQINEVASAAESLLEKQGEGTHGYTRAEQIAALRKLRDPFNPTEIRHRPQPYCKGCSETKTWPKVCSKHHEIKCERCKTKVTEAHICLKFVGHAEATNRLLNTDPFWNWEPFSLDQVGLPKYDQFNGMWIRLTVCGMTRIGYGDAGGKSGANAVKEIIGDAIRNAGMRFGMALDLWTPSDLEIIESGGASLESSTPQEPSGPQYASTGQDKGGQLAALKAKIKAGWLNRLSCEQNLAEARQKGLLDEVVPVGEEKVRVEDLLTGRIKKLKEQAAQGGDNERSAA